MRWRLEPLGLWESGGNTKAVENWQEIAGVMEGENRRTKQNAWKSFTRGRKKKKYTSHYYLEHKVKK